MNDLEHPPAEVITRGLQRVYKVGAAEVRALREIDLEMPAGQFLGIVGVSGSGKSTLLHLLGGLDSPTAGDIEVAGHRLVSMKALQRSLYRRKVIGFVFQSFYLVPHLTAEANVRLALTFQGVYGADRRRLAVDALQRVGLADRLNHRPGQLSGGEQQRVAIARAIVHRPRLLLADEPTGNLDRTTAESLLSLVCEIQHESNMTVIMATHDEELAKKYCGRLVRMRDGCFVTGEE